MVSRLGTTHNRLAGWYRRGLESPRRQSVAMGMLAVNTVRKWIRLAATRNADAVRNGKRHMKEDQAAAVPGCVIHFAGGEWPLVLGVVSYQRLTGDERSTRAIRYECESGVIPTLPRPAGSGAHWRIPTARVLERLGLPFTVGPATSAA